MKSLPNFDLHLHSFIQDEARREAAGILNEKETPRNKFNLENLRKFSYKDQLDKFQRTNPLLLAVIIGTLSKDKVAESEMAEISRKGFGGSDTSADITLVPTGKQSFYLNIGPFAFLGRILEFISLFAEVTETNNIEFKP